MNENEIKVSVNGQEERSIQYEGDIEVRIDRSSRRIKLLTRRLQDMDFNIEVFIDYKLCHYIRMRHKEFTKWYKDFSYTEFTNSKSVMNELRPHGRINSEHIENVLKYADILIKKKEYTFHEKDDEEINPIFTVFRKAYNEYENGVLNEDNVLLIEKKEIFLSKSYVRRALHPLGLEDGNIKAYAKKLADNGLINLTSSGKVEFQPYRKMLNGKRFYSFKKEAVKYV